MIEKMTKYSFILLTPDEDRFLSDLSGLGMVDITRSSKPIDQTSAAMLARVESIKDVLRRLDAASFDGDPEAKAIDSHSPGKFDDPLVAATEAFARMDELQEKIDAAHSRREELLHWGRFDSDTIRALEAKGLKVRFYNTRVKDFDSGWASRWPVFEISRDSERVWFVTVSDDPDYSFPVAEVSSPGGDFRETDEEIGSMKKSLLDCKRRINAIKLNYHGVLEDQASSILSELDKYLARDNRETAAEDKLTIYTGFAPAACDNAVAVALDKMPVYCLRNDATPQDEPPIRLRNNKFVDMFRVLTDMYGRPAYDGFDPTIFIAIFFTLFFAFCMGDLGYGIVILLGSFLLKKTSMKDSAPLVATLGAATMIAGFLFHSFFSVDFQQWNFIPEFLKKVMLPSKIDIPGMGEYDFNMALALVVGIVHISIAQVTKAIVSTRNSGFINSLGTWGWTLLIVGCVIVGAFAILGVMEGSAAKTALFAVLIVSAVLIFILRDIHKNPLVNVGNGLWETYNTATGLLSDVLSYLRLYALCLAGSMLGSSFNQMGMMVVGDGSIPTWAIGILIIVIGHVLNIAISGLSAFVHPLRLNFLEFFKNSDYQGSGRNYSPLGGTEEK